MTDPSGGFVRPATTADCGAVGEIQADALHQQLRGAAGTDLPTEVLDQLTPAALAQAWANAVAEPPGPAYQLLVATAAPGNEAEPLGAVAVCPSDDPDAEDTDAELSLLAVGPAHRRRGHGSRLLNAAADVLRDVGCTRLSAWVPSTDGTTLDFLRRAGFEADGAFRETGPEDDHARVHEVRLVVALS